MKNCYIMEAEQQAEWARKLPKAKEKFYNMLDRHHPHWVYSTRFERVDKSGYWFSFRLVYDVESVYEYLVLHSEI